MLSWISCTKGRTYLSLVQLQHWLLLSHPPFSLFWQLFVSLLLLERLFVNTLKNQHKAESEAHHEPSSAEPFVFGLSAILI